MKNFLPSLYNYLSISPKVLERLVGQFFILTAFLVGIFLEWEWIAIFLLCFLVYHVLFPLKGRLLLQIGLLLLVLVPIISGLGRDARAEEVLFFSYFLILMAIVTWLIELGRERGKDSS